MGTLISIDFPAIFHGHLPPAVFFGFHYVVTLKVVLDQKDHCFPKDLP